MDIENDSSRMQVHFFLALQVFEYACHLCVYFHLSMDVLVSLGKKAFLFMASEYVV